MRMIILLNILLNDYATNCEMIMLLSVLMIILLIVLMIILLIVLMIIGL